MEKIQEISVVDEFPLKISEGDSYTFSNSVAKKVTYFTHGLHTYPAKFIPQIPRWSFKFSKLQDNSVVLDPFVGCGTTMVEARINRINSYGIEINPLGRMLSEVKSTSIFEDNPEAVYTYSKQLISQIKKDKQEISLDDNNEYFNLHENWSFWFPEELLGELIKIKLNIMNYIPHTLTNVSDDDLIGLRQFYLVVLSTIIKKSSYFDEGQIKVKRKIDKFYSGYPNVIDLFSDAINKHQKGLITFIKNVKKDGIFAKVIGEDARNIELDDSSIDLIITSPPYINAVDYPMAHKYNLFVLDLVNPSDYKNHCRKYIGMTERAVMAKDYQKIHLTGYNPIDNKINAIYNKGSNTDKNRAFILYQYFSGMENAFKEFYRVLKSNKNFIIIVGNNNIRGEYIKTADYLTIIAASAGFKKINSFRHYYKNIRLKLTRNETAGKINYENILILRKE